MLLLGPPGTGKTLSAKLTAKALGYSLLALSWGNVEWHEVKHSGEGCKGAPELGLQ